MQDRRRWDPDEIVGNPIYVLSAMVMMYAISVLLGGETNPGDIGHILLIYGSLQIYECAMIGLAVWITVKLVVPDDAATLLILESLMIGAGFITLDEMLSTNMAWGMAFYGVGLALAAVKLSVVRRPLNMGVGRVLRAMVWLSLALPVLWVPTMKTVVREPLLSGWVAYLAWWSLGGLILVATFAVWASPRRQPEGRSILPSAILAATTVMAVGGHLFALHHTFVATPRLSFVAPVVVAVACAVVLAVLVTGRPLDRWTFALSWLPCLGLALQWGAPSEEASIAGGREALTYLLAEVIAVYACLMVMTRRRWLALHLCIIPTALFTDQRRAIIEHLVVHRGWWLAGLAFVLLAVGAWLTHYKHHRKSASDGVTLWGQGT